MPDTSISSQIYQSREHIRTQIADYIKSYLELENVDLTKTSFLSFIVNIFSTLTSNLMFYQSSVYREFFMTTAQLPESVYNLSPFIGYVPRDALYAIANVLVTVPLGFEDANTSFIIPAGFQLYAGEIIFVNTYNIKITIVDNAIVTIVATEPESSGGRMYNLPVSTNDTDFSFVLPVNQIKASVQEFQLDEDLQPYQFSTIDVTIDGKVSNVEVKVADPGTPIENGLLYSEFKSLYLMSDTDRGYVIRKTDTGRTIYFGNGLIGFQPKPGSTVRVTIWETEGLNGNVIANSISRSDRVYYTTVAGKTTIVQMTVSNTSPAFGGEDEESIEEIRTNSIASLTSLNRLVSESDFVNAKIIIPEFPISGTSLPILKRSDVKCNEIQLFVNLVFRDEVVPTKNIKYIIPLSTTYIPRSTIINIDGTDFITLFDMNVDVFNSSVTYDYIVDNIQVIPSMIRSYGTEYNFFTTGLKVQKSGGNAIFEFSYNTSETNYDTAQCVMEILETSQKLYLFNDVDNKKFTYEFSPYINIPPGSITTYFTISAQVNGVQQNIVQYQSIFIFRKPLEEFMLSNTFVVEHNRIIYDIPVIKRSYYESIDSQSFELEVLQTMLSSLSFYNYRMLTDFINIKFTNATGRIMGMKYNRVTKRDVKDWNLTYVPDDPDLNERYIVSGFEYGLWAGRKNMIAEWSGVEWVFEPPVTNDVLKITHDNTKIIFSEMGWTIPEYDIPLQIELEIFRTSSYGGSDIELSNKVKEILISTFSDRFGSNITLYRSEIVQTVQSIEGVSYCHLLKPESNIFFNYKLEELTQDQLLEYSAEYVYFTSDSIIIRVM